VLVPFGSAEAQAVVVGVPATIPDVPIRFVKAVLDPEPVASEPQIHLARWISEHYCCPFIDALALLFPPGVARRPQTFLSLVEGVELPSEVGEAEFVVLELLRQARQVELRQVRRALAQRQMARQTDRIVRGLLQRGLIRREVSLQPARIRPRVEWFVRAAGTSTELADDLAGLGRARRQRAMLERLATETEPESLPLALLRDEGLGGLPIARALVARGSAVLEQHEVRRDPLAHRAFPVLPSPTLTPSQTSALDAIRSALARPGYHPFLLFGVTGSGKTEVYLQTIAEVLRQGKRAIVLVPEIALTPQTLQRFAGRFPGRVAILHSRLTDGERFDEWRRIRAGYADVIIGSRSAIFAPVARLGTVIVDEEHEWSYKHDRTPRYHARDVALKLAELAGVTVVLGSATPSLETYYRSERGEIQRLELPDRVVGVGGEGPEARTPGLPPVEIVDLRDELKTGNKSIFSGALRAALEQTLALREQSILFLNRRGDSTFILCRDCGFVMQCQRCDAPLVYHSDVEDLVCHLCDARQPVPAACPACGGERIRFFGIGTQKLEAETRKTFPAARVLRWDRDAARARGAHEELLRRFTNHEADILVGTQMIAKGLDLPRVTLVGVVTADMALHLPDFRAVERTFQLLTQVAGRAGRGPLGGRVIVQAYTPEHYCIQAAQSHDYRSFYQREIAFRREHGYPPFGELARLLHVGNGEDRIQRDAEQLAALLRLRLRREGVAGIEIIGPAPAFHRKIRGRYRWHILLRGRQLANFLRDLDLPPGWSLDVDPVSTL
jgi:primosomal protein N' (replication factor Y)